jgi:hypothetical protein
MPVTNWNSPFQNRTSPFSDGDWKPDSQIPDTVNVQIPDKSSVQKVNLRPNRKSENRSAKLDCFVFKEFFLYI